MLQVWVHTTINFLTTEILCEVFQGQETSNVSLCIFYIGTIKILSFNGIKAFHWFFGLFDGHLICDVKYHDYPRVFEQSVLVILVHSAPESYYTDLESVSNQ
jgi:hypothetical protein